LCRRVRHRFKLIVIGIVSLIIASAIFYIINYIWLIPLPIQLGEPIFFAFCGLLSAVSLIVTIGVLIAVSAPHFDDSLELLDRLVKIFDEGLRGKTKKVSLLYFAPCPGLLCDLTKVDGAFVGLRKVMAGILERQDGTPNPVDYRICMLGKEGRGDFLSYFYEHEKERISEKQLKESSAPTSTEYIEQAELFLKRNFDPLCPVLIDYSWVNNVINNGGEFIVLGAGNRFGFIGSISFPGGRFRFKAADFDVDTALIHVFYDNLKEVYSKTVNDAVYS